MSRAREEFRPFPLLANPNLQTVLGSLVFSRAPRSERRLVELPDGDRLSLEVSTPAGWAPGDRTVVMIHGLCGCHESAYQVRLASRLCGRGIRAIRLNLRGCGSGVGLARGIYHSGRSGDVLCVLEKLRSEDGEGRIDLIGFSLGGNIALKLVGELGEEAPRWLDGLIGVCPPVDLAVCARMLGEAWRARYERFFVRLLYKSAHDRRRRFPDTEPLDLPESPEGVSIREFDDRYTAPLGGFDGVDDYYVRASSRLLLEEVRVPCRVLFAEDDPFIDATATDALDLPDGFLVEKTSRGGHLGFLGSPFRPGGLRWMDARILGWLDGFQPFSR